jgi:hypothetical protein
MFSWQSTRPFCNVEESEIALLHSSQLLAMTFTLGFLRQNS